MAPLTATFWNESQGTCDCCGQTTKTIWGDLSDDDGTHAIYYVQWTVGSTEHFPNVDLIVGPWGEGTQASQRQLVCLRFRPSPNGGSFMVMDAGDRHHSKAGLCGHGLRRDEIVGTPLAPQVFQLVDALWLTEPRIEDIKALCTPLPPS